MNKLKPVLKILIAVALITFVLHSGHFKFESIRGLLTAPAIAVGLALIGMNLWLLNWRWYWLLHSRKFPVSLSSTFSLYLIGVFFNYALPSSVGGDVVKAYYLARHHSDRKVDAVLSVLIDRVLGLYSLLLISAAAIAYDWDFVYGHPDLLMMATGCLALIAAMSIAFVIGFSTRVDRFLGFTSRLRAIRALHKIAEVFEAMQTYGRLKSAIAVSIGVSILGQLVSLAFFYGVGQLLGFTSVPPAAYVFAVPLGYLATALPIAPAGVGVGQLAFLYLFQAYSPGSGDLGAISITAFQIAMLAWGGIGAILYVRFKHEDSGAQ